MLYFATQNLQTIPKPEEKPAALKSLATEASKTNISLHPVIGLTNAVRGKGKFKCRGRKSVVTCILEASFAVRGGLLYSARGALNHFLRDNCSKITVTNPTFCLTG